MVDVYDRHTFARGANTSTGAASADIIHPHSVPIECLSKRRMLERTPISTSLMGNKPITKLIQMFQPTSVFSLLVVSQEMEMGVLQHNITMILGEGQTKLMLKRIGWNLKEKAKLMPPFDEYPTLNHILLMNIIVWNCKGALKPSFQNRIRDLVRDHSLAILVVMETQVGGERAKEITNRLPFDGAIHTDTIGYVRGL